MSLDPLTVLVISVLLAQVLSGILAALKRSLPNGGRGLNEWAWAYFAFTLSAGLLFLRSSTPPWLGDFVPVVLLLGGYGLLLAGVARHVGQAVPRAGIVAGWLVGSSWHAFALWGLENYPLRAFGVAVVEFAVCMAIFRLLRPQNGPSRSSLGTSVLLLGFGADTVLTLARAVFLLGADPAPASTLSADPVQTGYLVLHAAIMVIWAVAFIMMVSERIRHEWEYLATHDSLTGALTRGAFNDSALRELERAQRSGLLPAFLLIDIDHFKQVNDTHGHAGGDELLKAFVELVRSLVRPHDVFSRYGGEEFIVMMPECPLVEAGQVAERIRGAVEASGFQVARAQCRFTVSIGVAVATRGGEDLDNIVARADERLYSAKQAGRNQVAG